MIQAITETGFNINVQTEDNRIDTSVASTQIRHLLKFTNDLDKSVVYAYGATETIKDRFTFIYFRNSYRNDNNSTEWIWRLCKSSWIRYRR